MPFDFDALIALVEQRGTADDPLDRIAAAEAVAADLSRLGDRLIGYYIERARSAGRSWSDIGAHLGVSRQAAQQRYTPRWTSLTIADLTRAGAFARCTARTRERLARAEDHARRLGQPAIRVEHLLLACLDGDETLAVKAIRAVPADPARIRAALTDRLPAAAEPTGTDGVPLDPSARRCLDAALGEALDLGHNYIGTEHLLLGALHVLGDVGGVTLDAARTAVRAVINDYLRRRA
jgi:hypothetical protein